MSEKNTHVAMSYRQITAELDGCESHEEVLAILREEVAGQNRPAFVNRIYGRYDTMRRASERVDIARAATGDAPPAWLQLPRQQPAASAPRRGAVGKAPATTLPGKGAPPAAGGRGAGAQRR